MYQSVAATAATTRSPEQLLMLLLLFVVQLNPEQGITGSYRLPQLLFQQRDLALGIGQLLGGVADAEPTNGIGAGAFAGADFTAGR